MLAGLESYDNLGDQILFDCCDFLVHNIVNKYDDVAVERLDIRPKYKKKVLCYTLSYILAIVYGIFKRCTFLKGKLYFKILDGLNYFRFWILYNKFYEKKLEGTDCLIFVGGAYLKFSGETFQYCIRILMNKLNKKKIPVMFNGIGIEGYDEIDIRCQKLKKVINYDCVKVITTRDDIELLNNKFLTSRHIVSDLVGDSALWLKDCYKISNCQNRKVVGINITYLTLFETYKLPYSKKFYINIYRELTQKLAENNIPFIFFTNGKKEDFSGGLELLKELSLDKKLLLPKPNCPQDLIAQINNFSCIVPLRLHACITAYALGIPSVGFIWNEKLIRFAKIVHMEGVFQRMSKLSIDKLVDDISKQMSGKFSNEIGLKLRVDTEQYLEQFISEVYGGVIRKLSNYYITLITISAFEIKKVSVQSLTSINVWFCWKGALT